MAALVGSVGLMHILMCSAKVLLGKCPVAVRALDSTCSILVVCEHVDDEVFSVFVDFVTLFACGSLEVEIMRPDMELQANGCVVAFVAAVVSALEWLGEIMDVLVIGQSSRCCQPPVTDSTDVKGPRVAFGIQVSTVAHLWDVFATVPAFCERRRRGGVHSLLH